MEERKRREEEGGRKSQRGTPTYDCEVISLVGALKGKKGKVQRQISRYELMRSQNRGGHTSFESRSDWIILCQHCYTREPYAASQGVT